MRVDSMEGAGGLHVSQCEAKGHDLGQKPEIECAWLSFRHADTTAVPIWSEQPLMVQNIFHFL